MAEKPASKAFGTPATPEHGEVEEFRRLIETYGRPLLAGLIVASVVFLAVKVHQVRRQGKLERAAQALAGADTPDAFREIVERYGDTPSGPIAALGLASRQYENAQYDEALSTYEEFQQTYPEHPMWVTVDACKAQCMEAQGRIEEAHAAFAAFVEAHPDHYMAPIARLGAARCLEQMGRYEEARAAYEDLIAADPDSEWAGLSESSLEYVGKKIRAGRTAAP